MTTIRCADGHQFDLGDPDGKIFKVGYHRCPRTGCLRNGFVVATPGETQSDTMDDMSHLDPGDVCLCETCGQPVKKASWMTPRRETT